ncbi:MAG: hypothetical protein QOK43_1854 [Acidimicrobiaceae bacterium]|nr:hypothetical protein [Acidimicrobiaceae bacterium]
MVDCAPSGGMLGQRLGLEPKPGLAQLAAQVRAQPLSSALVEQQLQRAGDVLVLAAPTSGRSVVAALTRLGLELVGALGELPGDVLIDCGRLWPGSPALPIVQGADSAQLVTRSTHLELSRVQSDAAAAVVGAAAVELLLVGEPGVRSPRAHTANDRYYDASHAAQTLRLPVAAVLGDDRRGAARVGFEAWWLDRSYLVRSARAAAQHLCDRHTAASPRDERLDGVTA